MVATLVELRSSAMAVTYYERDGYYAKYDPKHRQASFWYGDAAKARALGLSRELMGPSKTQGESIPSARRAARKVMVRQRP